MAGTNPRAGRVAALIHRVIASATEGKLHDKRLRNVTITEVRVTNDLHLARVYWTQLAQEGKAEGERERAKAAFKQATGRLRSMVGSQLGLRLTPQLQFLYDEVPQEAHEIEDALELAHRRDEELKRVREHAQYAAGSDPYRHESEEAHGDDGVTDDGFGSDDDDFFDDVDDDEFVSEASYGQYVIDAADPFDGERAYDEDADDDSDEDRPYFSQNDDSSRSHEHE